MERPSCPWSGALRIRKQLLVARCVLRTRASAWTKQTGCKYARCLLWNVRLNGRTWMTLVAAANYANIPKAGLRRSQGPAAKKGACDATRSWRVTKSRSDEEAYAFALYADPSSTPTICEACDARGAVPIARRALGAEHLLTPVLRTTWKRRKVFTGHGNAVGERAAQAANI